MTVELLGTDPEPEYSMTKYSSKTTFSNSLGSIWTITGWQPRRVVLLYTNILVDQENRCHYDPWVSILRFPLREQRFPTQHWKGEECEGSMDVRVVGRETVRAAGRTWKTWKLLYRIVYQIGSLQGTRDETVWFAPRLGMEAKIQRVVNGAAEEGTFRSEQTATLRRLPS